MGKCADCGAEIPDSRTKNRRFCDECLAERRRVQRRESYAYRKRHGICVQCGGKSTEGALCQKCRDTVNERNRNKEVSRYERLKSQGLCFRCGKPLDSGKSMCNDCLEKESIYRIAYRARKKAEALLFDKVCERCGKKFKAKCYSTRYCSHTCSAMAGWKEWRERNEKCG